MTQVMTHKNEHHNITEHEIHKMYNLISQSSLKIFKSFKI